MRQYKLCIQIIIIIIIIVIKKWIKSKVKTDRGRRTRKRERERDFYFIFLIFTYFSNLQKSDRRFLSEQKAKLDYATKATRRYQYFSVSSNFKR